MIEELIINKNIETKNKNIKSILLDNGTDKDIYVPKHPIWTSIEDFGSDSALSAGLNPIAIYFADKITNEFWKKSTMLVGVPILDKLLFFPRHIIKGYRNYNHIPKKQRGKLSKYMMPELDKGLENVVADIMFQDTAYAGLLYLALEKWPDASPSLLGFLSCVAGIIIAGPAKVMYKEGLFLNKAREIKKTGFTNENYWESRFKIPIDHNYNKFFENFAKEFNMTFQGTANYQDTYIANNFKEYNDRTVKVRLRQHEANSNNKLILDTEQNFETTLDIYFARAHKKRSEDKKNMHYPIWKEKFSYNVENCIENVTLDSLPNSKQVEFIKKNTLNQNNTLKYTRTNFSDHKLTINMDDLNGNCPFHFLEITVKEKETHLLQEAMKYVKLNCPTVAADITYDFADIREKDHIYR